MTTSEQDHRTEDQSRVEAFLADPATHGGAEVERIETHAAVVFLAGDTALKMKKAVAYAFLDFSTLEKRRATCEHELVRGRRIAPTLYRRIVAVTEDDTGALALDGAGRPVEWCVEMHRFAQDALLSEIAGARGIDDRLAGDLGDAVWAMHAGAAPRDGGARTVREVIATTIRPTLGEETDLFARARVEALLAAMDRSLLQLGPLLDARGREGHVRLCHGDLHLANIVLIDGRPVPFDAIEFDDRLATTDTAYDLAFLLMDLWERGFRRAANGVLVRYLEASGDYQGLTAMPLFLAMRAAIRAMVRALRGEREAGLAYFGWAERFIAPAPARLIAIGGLSGTGKTTLARDLAPQIGPPPGAVLLRSDVERKQLFGVGETERLGEEAYTPEASARVYGQLMDKAYTVLQAGHAVIFDAVQAREAEREAIEGVAREAGVCFTGLWLEAPIAVLKDRVGRREGDASDADTAVVASQARYDLGRIAWARLDAARPAAALAREAAEVLGR